MSHPVPKRMLNGDSPRRSSSLRRRLTFVFGSALLVSIFFLHACTTMRSSPEEIEALLARADASGTFRTIEHGNRTIVWIEAGRESGPLVMFVHGSPGSLDAFAGFFEDRSLLEEARLASIDRPGFGYSGLGHPEPSLARQAEAVAMAIDAMPDNRPVILVGHSYAGPVIARVVIDRPDLVAGLVLVAPSIDPDLEPKYWFQRPLASPVLRWLVPRPLRASNEEILALEPELRDMLPLWEKIDVPVIVIQGGADRLVPPGNAEFARRMLVNAKVDIVLVDDMKHFVPWTNPELIRKAIEVQLDRISQERSVNGSLD